MNYITKNTPSLHPSIIDGLIYFSKKNKGTLKKEQLIHFLGNDDNLSELNIIEAAQQLNLKCEFSFFNSESEYKDKIIIDTLIEINGYWYILKNRTSDKLIIIDPSTNTESHYHIDKKITYTTLLIINKIFTPKQSKFSLMWCIPSLLKQKKSLYLIFILSCFIQLFALVNPIIFEKIIDKVLTGRSLSNLQVLGVLLVLLAIIEPIYLLLRDKLYAFVSCTLGAEFSGKIYQHLIRLPSQFFNQRQSGQIIARIQELAHIRQFITGSALMMVLDFIFIIVFLSVMFAYSVLLTWITIAALVVYFLFWLILGPMIRY